MGETLVHMVMHADWVGLAVVAAPFVGSFLSTLAARWPDWRGAVAGRSACPCCHTRLEPRDLVPVLSWLWLRGRCRHCGAPIGAAEPVAEMAATAIALWALLALPPATAGPALLLGWTLLALALIDRHHFLLPDVLTLPLIAAGLALAYFTGGSAALTGAASGAALGYGLLAGAALLYRRLRGRDGLGYGDAKLLAAAGPWVGWSGLGMVLLVASAMALAVAALGMRRGRVTGVTPIPFGPYLAAATWIGALHGPLLA